MSLDNRIQPKTRPMFGCHSDLDKYKTGERPPCEFKPYGEEKACDGCEHSSALGNEQSLEYFNRYVAGDR